MENYYLNKYLLDEPGVYVKNLHGGLLTKAARILAIIGLSYPGDLHNCLKWDSLGVHIKRNPAGGVFIIASNGDTEVVFEDNEAVPSEEFESVTLDIRHPDKSRRDDIHPIFDLLGSVSGHSLPLIKRGKYIPDEPGTAVGGGYTTVDLRTERLWEWSIKQKFARNEHHNGSKEKGYLVIDETIKEVA